MTASHIVGQLKELIKLEEHRESLQATLDKLGSRINALKDGLVSGGGSSPARKTRGKRRKASKPALAIRIAKAPSAKKAAPRKKAAPTPRGALMAGILRELEAAGAKGATVKDLSAKLKVDYKNIYIWFVTTGKKNARIRRVGPARFRLLP